MDQEADEQKRDPTSSERAARREADLHAVVLPRVKEAFDASPDLASALLVVAQYWADNANDQVHGHIVFSREAVPRWPHVCAWRDAAAERCTRCWRRAGGSYFSLPYGEPSSRAWEAYCQEHAHQDQEVSQAYLPYGVVRRRGAHGLSPLERVGDPVRPWLDEPDAAPAGDAAPEVDAAPAVDAELLALVYADPDDVAARHVLADALLERGDPRGEHIALTLADDPSGAARERADALLREHHRSWLGPLARVVPWGAASFDAGFPDRVAAFFPEERDLAWVADAAGWQTVRSLTFLPRSREIVRPTMKNLRSIGPIRGEGIIDIGSSDVAFAIERLVLRPLDGAIEVLAEADVAERLPRLATLVVVDASTSPDDLVPLLAAPLGARLRALHLAPWVSYDAVRPFDPDLVAAWVAARRPLELAFGRVGENGEPAGFWLHLHGAGGDGPIRAEITVPALGTRFDLGALAETLGAVSPDVRGRIAEIALRRSRWFCPTDRDVAIVADATGRPARIVP